MISVRKFNQISKVPCFMRRGASGRGVGACYWFLSIGDMIMDQKMAETLRQITELNEDE